MIYIRYRELLFNEALDEALERCRQAMVIRRTERELGKVRLLKIDEQLQEMFSGH